MRFARRTSQLLFFLLFIVLFLQATYPYDPLIPSDLFLKADPLIALTTIISTKQLLLGSFVIAFILLILTVVLGRFFCGWMCPLGLMIDLSDKLYAVNRSQKVPNRRHRLWKYSLTIVIFISAIFSVQWVWLFDPLSIITRSFTVSLYPLFNFLVEAVFNLLIQIGIFQETLFAWYGQLRGTIIPIEATFFRSSVIITIVFLTILLLGMATKRYWCRYLCPLGALFAVFSHRRFLKRIVNTNCIDCGRCYRECKMDAIDESYRTFSPHECIECQTCVTVCPVHAFEYKLNLQKMSDELDVSRRRFLFSSLGGLIAFGITKTAFIDKAHAGNVIRPPGAVPESEFLDRCVRCHECIKICSTTGKYLQPAFLESGWEGIWTPIADARHGYCEYYCNLCSLVCPTRAIHPIDIQLKQQMPIGTAYFDKSRCIPWYRHEDCIVCEEHCPTPDKAIKFEVKSVQKPDGSIHELKYPYIDENLCIGCGICVTKCPIEGKAGIFVTNARQQRYISD